MATEHRLDRPEGWHAWFLQQAEWTRPARLWLYRQAGLLRARRVLEVGCGTGVIAGELSRMTRAQVVGLDLDGTFLALARAYAEDVSYVQGDAHVLPFASGSFDIAVCHFLLLWVVDPGRVVQEMARVVHEQGAVLACAEPDYGGRVDYPVELASLGRMQAEVLRRQGADPEIGRRLGEFFTAAGLWTTVGVIGGRWELPAQPDSGFHAEWAMRRHDLRDVLPAGELRRLEQAERAALLAGRRIFYVPTFYALGRKVGESAKEVWRR